MRYVNWQKLDIPHTPLEFNMVQYLVYDVEFVFWICSIDSNKQKHSQSLLPSLKQSLFQAQSCWTCNTELHNLEIK